MSLFTKNRNKHQATFVMENYSAVMKNYNDLCNSIPVLEAFGELPSLLNALETTQSKESLALLEFIIEQKYEVMGVPGVAITTEDITDVIRKAVAKPMEWLKGFVGKGVTPIANRQVVNLGGVNSIENELDKNLLCIDGLMNGSNTPHLKDGVSVTLLPLLDEVIGNRQRLLTLRDETVQRLETVSCCNSILDDIELSVEGFYDIEIEDVIDWIDKNKETATSATLKQMNEGTVLITKFIKEVTLSTKQAMEYVKSIKVVDSTVNDYSKRLDFKKLNSEMVELFKMHYTALHEKGILHEVWFTLSTMVKAGSGPIGILPRGPSLLGDLVKHNTTFGKKVATFTAMCSTIEKR